MDGKHDRNRVHRLKKEEDEVLDFQWPQHGKMNRTKSRKSKSSTVMSASGSWSPYNWDADHTKTHSVPSTTHPHLNITGNRDILLHKISQ